jgi:hypothetical protein
MGAELLDAADITRAWGAALIEENAEMAGAGLFLLALCATLEERLAGPSAPSGLRLDSRAQIGVDASRPRCGARQVLADSAQSRPRNLTARPDLSERPRCAAVARLEANEAVQ